MRVRIEIVPWLTQVFDSERTGRMSWCESVDETTTVASLLDNLAGRYPGFAETVGRPETGGFAEHICVVLKGEILSLPDGLSTTLQDGDVIVLLPAFSGGVCGTVAGRTRHPDSTLNQLWSIHGQHVQGAWRRTTIERASTST